MAQHIVYQPVYLSIISETEGPHDAFSVVSAPGNDFCCSGVLTAPLGRRIFESVHQSETRDLGVAVSDHVGKPME